MEYLILAFVVGMVIGSVIANFTINRLAAKAVLRIDHSDIEKDIYRLDLNNIDLDERSHLLLKIDHNANLTQE